MDSTGIKRDLDFDPKKKPENERATCQQRCVWLNKPFVLEERCRRAAAATAAVAAKAAATAQKVADKAVAAQKKAAFAAKKVATLAAAKALRRRRHRCCRCLWATYCSPAWQSCRLTWRTSWRRPRRS